MEKRPFFVSNDNGEQVGGYFIGRRTSHSLKYIQHLLLEIKRGNRHLPKRYIEDLEQDEKEMIASLSKGDA